MTALINRIANLPSAWDQSIADQYEVGKIINTSEWTAKEFLSINMYAAYTQVCECHGNSIRQCLNNPSLHWKAQDYTNFLNKVIPVAATFDEDGEEIAPGPVAFRQKNGKRGRVKTTLNITPEILDEAEKLFPSIGLVASAKQLNVNAAELSTGLKGRNIVISRGKKKTS